MWKTVFRILAPCILLSAVATASAKSPTDNSGFLEVMGGEPAAPGAWPDVAAIVSIDGYSECTGVLIAPDVVLTAGHCLATYIDHVVLNTVDLGAPQETIAVVGQVEYPQSWNTLDLGLLFLAEPSAVEPRVIARDCVADAIADGAPATLVGWGHLDPWGTWATELQQAETTILDAQCIDPGLGCNGAVLPGGELIAGGDGVDACPGDSGGPLYVDTEHGAFLSGIVSRALATVSPGQICGDGGIYARPDAALDWIEQQIGAPLATPDCDADPEDADPLELLAQLIDEFRDYRLGRPLLKRYLVWLLRSAERLLADADPDNDLRALERLETFARLAQRAGVSPELINMALRVIELWLEPEPEPDPLPDLTDGLAANPECGWLPSGQLPAATLFTVGDIAFAEGQAEGSESFLLFGNDELIARGGFESCAVRYGVTGTHDAVDDAFELQFEKQEDDCPAGMLFPSSFAASYRVDLAADGTATVNPVEGNWQADGYWTEGRFVYRSESCMVF